MSGRAGLLEGRQRWGVGCAFVDYDRDGKLDIFAVDYIDLDLATAPVPESGLCRYKGIQVACGQVAGMLGIPSGTGVTIGGHLFSGTLGKLASTLDDIGDLLCRRALDLGRPRFAGAESLRDLL